MRRKCTEEARKEGELREVPNPPEAPDGREYNWGRCFEELVYGLCREILTA